MNLTSLLNIGTTAVEQQKKMESSCNTLIRNRTPWDAGGYSLPINTISRASHSISPQQIQSDVSRKLENQTPISPTPRFSNSRSDRSSFASFLPSSTTHSRYSSISTVNSTYHLNNFAPDKISPKLTNVPHALELPAIDSQSDTRLSTSISPTGSLDSLALVAENHLFSQLPNQQSSDRVTAENLNGRGSDESLSQLIPCHRPSSPSDAILIKRSTIPILKVDTRDRDRDSEKEDLPRSNDYLSAHLRNLLQQPAHAKFHQRSFSAPNFWSTMDDSNMQHTHMLGNISDNHKTRPADQNSDHSGHNKSFALNHERTDLSLTEASKGSAYNTLLGLKREANPVDRFTLYTKNIISPISTISLGPRAELTPPSSSHPDRPSPTGCKLSNPIPDSPPVTVLDNNLPKIECMFVAACNTGSQLRKAISHILGRNKLCTRQIPTEIWVHFCRKHYQRSRYRNPKEYSKLQCDLVQKQIRRIHEWSKENAEAGRPGVLQGWELTIRKREQKRLSELSTTNRKRRSDTIEENEDDEDDEEETATAGSSRSFCVLTAVPQWLLDCCRKGYTTREILEVFNRLHTEVLADRITHFPDIEILPSITTDPDVPKSPKGYAKRDNTATHRRTQSVGPALQSTSSCSVNHSSQSFVSNAETVCSPQQKRRCPGGRVEETFDERIHLKSRNGEGQMGTGRRMPQLTHRPVFPDIRENQREEHGHDHCTRLPSSYQNPLPAPTPQRFNNDSMAAHLENESIYNPATRRSVHGRSRSDISCFSHHQMEHDLASASISIDANQASHYQAQNRGQSDYTYPPSSHRTYQRYRDGPSVSGPWPEMCIGITQPSHVHQRHQSTPQTLFTEPSLRYGRPNQPPNYPIPQRLNSSSPFAYRVSDTGEARDLYSARR